MKTTTYLPRFAQVVLGPLRGLTVAMCVVMAGSRALGDDRADVSTLLLRYGAELNASHTSAIVELYTSDGVFMPSGAPTAVGTGQLRVAYDKVFEAIKLAVKFEIDEVDVQGDIAFARTFSRGNVTILANGVTQPEENRELFILRRVSGAWRIARYMFNQPRR